MRERERETISLCRLELFKRNLFITHRIAELHVHPWNERIVVYQGIANTFAMEKSSQPRLKSLHSSDTDEPKLLQLDRFLR